MSWTQFLTSDFKLNVRDTPWLQCLGVLESSFAIRQVELDRGVIANDEAKLQGPLSPLIGLFPNPASQDVTLNPSLAL